MRSLSLVLLDTVVLPVKKSTSGPEVEDFKEPSDIHARLWLAFAVGGLFGQLVNGTVRASAERVM
jgi:hypothetical protein